MKKILEWIISSFFLIFVTPIVFVVEYAIDVILGNSYLQIGHNIINKYPKIKSIKLFQEIWRRIQPKNLYLRYETPIVSYIFSYIAISFFSVFLIKTSYSIIVSTIIYLILYFAGMIRKFTGDEDHLKKILNSNLEFLKLSFLPLAFIITVCGFIFTITGMKIQEVVDWEKLLTKICNVVINFMEENNNLYYPIVELIILIFKFIVVLGILLVFLYVISIPLQVVSYGIIMIMMYFINNKRGYIRLWNKCLLFAKLVLETDKIKERLYLVWNCPTNKRQYVVGQLIRKEQYEFNYCNDIEVAIDAGFRPLDQFENLHIIYRAEDLFDVFANRLPDKNREDIDKILEKYGMKEYDSYQLLKNSGAKIPTDNLEFVDHILIY